jgi:hypothetical protein
MTMYAVIEADGFFGDQAKVCEVHAERAKAIKSVQHDRRWQVIGGPGSQFEVGQAVHRNAIGAVYPHVEKTL